MEAGRFSERLISFYQATRCRSFVSVNFYRLLRWFKVIISLRVDEDGEKDFVSKH